MMVSHNLNFSYSRSSHRVVVYARFIVVTWGNAHLPFHRFIVKQRLSGKCITMSALVQMDG